MRNIMKVEVDSIMRKEQAGFRENISFADHITALRMIIEQSQEWNHSVLVVNFIDVEKAFDSIYRVIL